LIDLTGPIALLFPGQGVQKPGMGKNLYDRYPAARRVFERAEEVLEMPVGTVKCHAHRGRARMRRALEPPAEAVSA